MHNDKELNSSKMIFSKNFFFKNWTPYPCPKNFVLPTRLKLPDIIFTFYMYIYFTSSKKKKMKIKNFLNRISFTNDLLLLMVVDHPTLKSLGPKNKIGTTILLTNLSCQLVGSNPNTSKKKKNFFLNFWKKIFWKKFFYSYWDSNPRVGRKDLSIQ